MGLYPSRPRGRLQPKPDRVETNRGTKKPNDAVLMKRVIYQNIIERDGRKYLETGYEEQTPTGVIRTAKFETYRDPNAQKKLF